MHGRNITPSSGRRPRYLIRPDERRPSTSRESLLKITLTVIEDWSFRTVA